MLTKIMSWFTCDRILHDLRYKKKHQPVIIARSQHTVSREHISKNALKVLYRLTNANYQGYLVGGGIRDLLLGIQPKDFDIVTDALPEEIRRLFRNCRLIGRRFRLAHIYFSKEIIEVSTFRAVHDNIHKTQVGMLLRDNVYGTIEEDVLRRDFTINAIYYNIQDFSLVDYVGGLEDIKRRQLRIIGDPITRYREDPVRMLRAIRFAGKLNLTFHKDTESPLRELAPLIKEVSSSRLFDEYLKLFISNNVKETFTKLIEYGLYSILFPQVAPFLQNKFARQFIEVALFDANKRTALQKPEFPIFMLAVFLWYPFLELTKKPHGHKKSSTDLPQASFERIMSIQRQTIMVPKRLTYLIRNIWFLQFKLIKLSAYEVVKCYKSASFRLAYDFLLLRAQAEEKSIHSAARWWRNYVEGTDQMRKRMLKKLKQ